MQIEIGDKELEMIIALLRYCDPTGFFTAQLIKSLSDQLKKHKTIEVKYNLVEA